MITVSTMFTIISIKPNNWHASPHHHQSEWTSSCVAKSKAFPHQPQHTDCWLWTYSRLIWSGYNWLKAIRIHLNFPKYKISSNSSFSRTNRFRILTRCQKKKSTISAILCVDFFSLCEFTIYYINPLSMYDMCFHSTSNIQLWSHPPTQIN